MVAAAREADPLMDIRLADAGALPLDDASADLAITFMSLHDIDLMPAAVREVARVLEPGGRLCVAIVHPSCAAWNAAITFVRSTSSGNFSKLKAALVFAQGSASLVKLSAKGTYQP